MKHYLVLEAKGKLDQQILYPILGNDLVSLVNQARYINEKDPREQPRPLRNTGHSRIALPDRDSHQISYGLQAPFDKRLVACYVAHLLKAQVAELVDALASGASVRKIVLVRVQSWAPMKRLCNGGAFLYTTMRSYLPSKRRVAAAISASRIRDSPTRKV